MKYYL